MAEPAPAGRTDERYADLKLRLERAARHVCPVFMRDHLDDIVQMALLKLLRSGKIEEEHELNNSFLYRVCHSVVVDELRSQKRRKETAIEPNTPDPPELASRSNPETSTGGTEIGLVIVECLGELSQVRRRAVTLYLQGHTVPETAERLGFTPKKTENLVYRGLADLRASLRKKGLEPDGL